jgi:hypothetical protein
MPEAGFVLAGSDELALANAVLDMGAVLVPDLHYFTDRPSEIRDTQSFITNRGHTRLFFVLHPTFQEGPLEMRQIVKDGKPSWYVGRRSGGPAITLLFCVLFDRNNMNFISEGSAHHYPSYWYRSLEANRPASASLKEFYGKLVAHLKSNARKQKIGKRNYWIGKATAAALDSGKLELGFGPKETALQR